MKRLQAYALHRSVNEIGALAFAILPYDILHRGSARQKASTNTHKHKGTLGERGPTSLFQAMLELPITMRIVEDRTVVLH
jgi:hypothetical protein